jgi:hypothetical protein
LSTQGEKSLPFERIDATIRKRYRLVELGYAPNVVADLIPGFTVRLPDALGALERTVDCLLHVSTQPVTVLQTGDIAAHRALLDDGSRAMTFPAVEYWWRMTKRWQERGARAVYNLSGNHDVWSGTLPGVSNPHCDAGKRTTLTNSCRASKPSPYTVHSTCMSR